MTHEPYASATLPVQDMGRPADAAEAAWMHAFFNGRIVVLGLGFAALPLALALMPEMVNSALPVVLAGLLSSTLGLIGLRYGNGFMAVAGAALGLSLLGLGPWLGGVAGATAGAALLSLGLEAAALPRTRRWSQAGLGALAAAAILVAAATLLSAGAPSPSVQAMAALLLPLAPAVTLVQVARASHQALAQRETHATDASRRDAMMVAAADTAVAVIDRGAHVLDLSPAAERLLAAGRSELAGRGLIDRVLIAERPALLKAVSDASVAGVETMLSLHLADPAPKGQRAGAPRFAAYDAMVRAVPDADGQVTLRLSPAMETPREAESRAALFASLSHEVRTPMNAILGFSEILANPALQPKSADQIAEYAGIVHKSATEAFAVTRAVVDLLRVESRDFTVEPERQDVREFAAGLVANLADKLPCRFEAEGETFEAVADTRCLRMALTNLIEGFANAGTPAPVVCRLGARDGKMVFSLSCASDVPHGRLGHAAYLGVVEALVRRIATLTGMEFSLSVTDSALSATLMLPESAVVTPLRPALPAVPQSAVIPLRKIA